MRLSDCASFILLFWVMMIGFKEFSILSWNVRGFANKRSYTHMREILKRYN